MKLDIFSATPDQIRRMLEILLGEPIEDFEEIHQYRGEFKIYGVAYNYNRVRKNELHVYTSNPDEHEVDLFYDFNDLGKIVDILNEGK